MAEGCQVTRRTQKESVTKPATTRDKAEKRTVFENVLRDLGSSLTPRSRLSPHGGHALPRVEHELGTNASAAPPRIANTERVPRGRLRLFGAKASFGEAADVGFSNAHLICSLGCASLSTKWAQRRGNEFRWKGVAPGSDDAWHVSGIRPPSRQSLRVFLFAAKHETETQAVFQASPWDAPEAQARADSDSSSESRSSQGSSSSRGSSRDSRSSRSEGASDSEDSASLRDSQHDCGHQKSSRQSARHLVQSSSCVQKDDVKMHKTALGFYEVPLAGVGHKLGRMVTIRSSCFIPNNMASECKFADGSSVSIQVAWEKHVLACEVSSTELASRTSALCNLVGNLCNDLEHQDGHQISPHRSRLRRATRSSSGRMSVRLAQGTHPAQVPAVASTRRSRSSQAVLVKTSPRSRILNPVDEREARIAAAIKNTPVAPREKAHSVTTETLPLSSALVVVRRHFQRLGILASFQAFDPCRVGLVGLKEFRTALAAIVATSLPENSIEELWAVANAEDAGDLSLGQLFAFLEF